MKRGVSVLVIFLVLLSVGAFAQTVSEGVVSQNVQKYVESFVEKGGITSDQIESVKEVDKSKLPDDIEIKKIENNKVGIYEVNYAQDSESKKVFVVTYSAEDLAKSEQVFKNIDYLDFGFDGSFDDSAYLKSGSGVQTGRDNGYVMMRSGSITGISTSLELAGDGEVEIEVYKNGVETGFSNLISSSDKDKKDYELQSENVVNYQAGDVISVYVKKSGEINWSNVVTLVEITN
jgi:hypothetical protein